MVDGLRPGPVDRSRDGCEQYENKSDKIAFLQKYIDLVNITLGSPLNVRANKIVAGTEVEYMNPFLQAISAIITDGMDWEAALVNSQKRTVMAPGSSETQPRTARPSSARGPRQQAPQKQPPQRAKTDKNIGGDVQDQIMTTAGADSGKPIVSQAPASQRSPGVYGLASRPSTAQD
eukprot:Clim_evm23s7 gene=Clim_evmTU23s7